MESSESLSRLYELINSKLGPTEARKAVLAAIGITINELVDQSKPISSENLNKQLESYVKDFIDTNKTNVA